MKQVKLLALVVGLCLCFYTMPAQAQGIWGACDPNVSSEICGDKTEATDIVKQLINFFLFTLGVVAVIMIIHSGMKYVTSRGDAEQVKSAKNTLLYAVIGLIVAMLAFTIVNFVIGIFSENGSDGAEDATGGGGGGNVR